MTARLTIVLLLLSLTTNNVVLAGALWLDENRAATGMAHHSPLHPQPEESDGEHEQHATHCCHLQAHFQTISANNHLMAEPVQCHRWSPRAVRQPHCLFDSPPTPPPKA